MVVHVRDTTPSRTLLLFGHIDLSFDEAAFHKLRTSLHATRASHQWVFDTIAELPLCFSALRERNSDIFTDSRLSLLQDLNGWINSEKPSLSPFVLPNILLNPLVVIAQLLQYSSYLKLTCPTTVDDRHLHATTQHNTETLGFCTGLLSAFAVSASTGDEQLRKHGATAIRLAMLIGAAVDAQEAPEKSGPSQSFSAAWHSQEQRTYLTNELEDLGTVG